MDWSRKGLPSLVELLAFDAAARHGSFTRAAEELRLTQGAVSRQIRGLEEGLGARLFERIRRQVVLTEVGRVYLGEVRKVLGTLAQAQAKVALFGAGEVLNLAVLPTFATRWLIPRLPAFLARHPGLTLNFMVRLEPFSFVQEPFDLAIHYGEPDWPGAEAHFLCGESSIAVASPRLVERQAVRTAGAVGRLPLLHQTTRPEAWSDWFRAAGLDPAAAALGPRFDQFAMITAAAVHGLGAALLPEFLIDTELSEGMLVRLPAAPLASRSAYWVMVPESKRSHPVLAALCTWLSEQAVASGLSGRVWSKE